MTIEEMAAKARTQLKAETKAEPKGAAPAPSAEIKKTEEEVKKVEPIEAKAEEVVELPKDESKVSTDEKPIEVKEEAKKSNVQKRIDELTGKIKEIESDRTSTKSERDALRAELDGIKKQLSMTPQDVAKAKVKNEIIARQKKYLDEDKHLPKEDRREMTKDELDDWLLEDYVGASEWSTRRTLRRVEEEREIKLDEENSQKANIILSKQQKSAERTRIKHSELDTANARYIELAKSGKPKDEILKALCDENPKYKLCVEIYNENPAKYMTSENGPELIVAEMEKRLSSKPEVNADIEAIKKELAAARAEVASLKGLDAGISSTRSAAPKEVETEVSKKQFELARKVGLTPERMKAAIARRAEKGYDG